MLAHSRSPRWTFAWTPLLALWAAVPTVLWCPPDLGEACMAAFARCSRAGVAPASCGDACPMAHDHSATVTHCADLPDCPFASASTPAREGGPCRRAFCVGDPAGGVGLLRNAAPLLSAPAPAVLVAAVEIAPPVSQRLARVPPRASRPPPRIAFLTPPARAPPSCSLT